MDKNQTVTKIQIMTTGYKPVTEFFKNTSKKTKIFVVLL